MEVEYSPGGTETEIVEREAEPVEAVEVAAADPAAVLVALPVEPIEVVAVPVAVPAAVPAALPGALPVEVSVDVPAAVPVVLAVEVPVVLSFFALELASLVTEFAAKETVGKVDTGEVTLVEVVPALVTRELLERAVTLFFAGSVDLGRATRVVGVVAAGAGAPVSKRYTVRPVTKSVVRCLSLLV